MKAIVALIAGAVVLAGCSNDPGRRVLPSPSVAPPTGPLSVTLTPGYGKIPLATPTVPPTAPSDVTLTPGYGKMPTAVSQRRPGKTHLSYGKGWRPKP